MLIKPTIERERSAFTIVKTRKICLKTAFANILQKKFEIFTRKLSAFFVTKMYVCVHGGNS